MNDRKRASGLFQIAIALLLTHAPALAADVVEPPCRLCLVHRISPVPQPSPQSSPGPDPGCSNCLTVQRPEKPFKAVTRDIEEVFASRQMSSEQVDAPGAPSGAMDADEKRAWDSLDSESRKLFGLINDYRRQHGVEPLHLSWKLTQSARLMTADMAATDWDPPAEMSGMKAHMDSKGRLPYDRNLLFGYTDTTNSENLVAGIVTAEEAFNLWKNSPGHDANLLRKVSRAIGIAWVRNPKSAHFGPNGGFWCTDFGSQLDREIIPWPAKSGSSPSLKAETSTSRLPARASAAALLSASSSPRAQAPRASLQDPVSAGGSCDVSSLRAAVATKSGRIRSELAALASSVGPRSGLTQLFDNPQLNREMSELVDGVNAVRDCIHARKLTDEPIGRCENELDFTAPAGEFRLHWSGIYEKVVGFEPDMSARQELVGIEKSPGQPDRKVYRVTHGEISRCVLDRVGGQIYARDGTAVASFAGQGYWLVTDDAFPKCAAEGEGPFGRNAVLVGSNKIGSGAQVFDGRAGVLIVDSPDESPRDNPGGGWRNDQMVGKELLIGAPGSDGLSTLEANLDPASKRLVFRWSNGATLSIDPITGKVSDSNFLAPDAYSAGCKTSTFYKAAFQMDPATASPAERSSVNKKFTPAITLLPGALARTK